MPRLLALIPLAVFLAACATVVPTPTPFVGPTASPTPEQVVTCGPLQGSPADCQAAVEAALDVSPTVSAVEAIHIETPATNCSESGGPCREPQIVVKLFGYDGSATLAEVPLVRSTSGWISFYQLR